MQWNGTPHWFFLFLILFFTYFYILFGFVSLVSWAFANVTFKFDIIYNMFIYCFTYVTNYYWCIFFGEWLTMVAQTFISVPLIVTCAILSSFPLSKIFRQLRRKTWVDSHSQRTIASAWHRQYREDTMIQLHHNCDCRHGVLHRCLQSALHLIGHQVAWSQILPCWWCSKVKVRNFVS